MNTLTVMSIARRLARLSPQAKVWVMIGGDAVFLPLCMLASVGFRLGSVESALATSPGIQIALALLALPVLAVAGLYRKVVRYIDLRVLAASSGALGVVVLLVYGGAVVFNLHVLPRSALLIFWFVAFAYVVTSRFVAHPHRRPRK